MPQSHTPTDYLAAAQAVRDLLGIDPDGSFAKSSAIHRKILEIGSGYGFFTADPRGRIRDGEDLIAAMEHLGKIESISHD